MRNIMTFLSKLRGRAITRRDFLRVGGLALGGLIYSSCDFKPTEPEEETLEKELLHKSGSLVAKIDGPTKVQCTRDKDVYATVKLDGSSSIGDISEYLWDKKSPSSQEYTNIGQGVRVLDSVREMGTHFYRLTVKDSMNQTDYAIHKTTVFLKPQDHQIAFYRYTSSGLYLCFMDPDNPENVELVLQNNLFNANTLSWEPNGNRLAMARKKTTYGKSNLHIYDIQSRTFEKILDTNGISWQTAWSPRGDWIAFVEDSRYNGRADELVLIQPDTRKVIYLAGDTTKEEFRGFYPTWDPMGERIALGHAIFRTSDDSMVLRIAIYSDLWGAPQRRRLHTEEYLQSQFGEAARGLDEGINGVAWSPNGKFIAYNAIGGPFSRNRVIIANADGSGITRILPYEWAAFPSWSPDSQYLIFEQIQSNGKFHICRVNKNGYGFVDLSIMSDRNADDIVPKWAN